MEKNFSTEIAKRYGIVIAISLVLFLSVTDIFFVSFSKFKTDSIRETSAERIYRSSGDELKKDIPRISEIKGPMITERAASSVCFSKNIPICKDLGSKAWILLFFSYLVLLVFNLAYGASKGAKLQWGWEALMTGIFVAFWFIFDDCAKNLWYPLYVIKVGLAVYAIYLYFFLKKGEKSARE